jgi:tetratricopeptide (TPR) repeat protein
LRAAVKLRWPLPDLVTRGLAFRADLRGDNQAVLRLWERIGRRHPDWTIVYAMRAGAFRRLERWDEAKAELQQGLARRPDDAMLTVELGRLLLEHRELDAALEVWRQVMETAPDRPESHVGYASTLRELAHLEEADAVLHAAAQKFPSASFVQSNYAVLADLRGAREEALRRWQTVLSRFSDEAIGYAGLGAALKMLGRYAEADDLMSQGMQRFPDDTNLAINHAWVAVAASDWAEALRRWDAMLARWPQDRLMQNGRAETAMRAALFAADETAHVANSHAEHTATSPHADIRQMLLQFESMGVNCELGFVQRHFGAEPLGLFRWAGISYESLLAALDTQLAGIGDVEHTILTVNPNNYEYHSEDRRYGMSTHTFVQEDSAQPEDVIPKVCRRLVFLKEKFLKDLREGSKIFVFNGTEPLPDAELRRLHDALGRYGDVSLLHVAPHGEDMAGHVTRVDERLWRGGLGRTGNNGRIWDIEFQTWVSVCRAALAEHRRYERAAASEAV